ncbi:hypothetical protein HAX54_005684 [Datura stramonium]|uniref:Uncharacterized protein n=1 Tax=Datura stramonium TaxID=4076 RepID=A0ABS8T979_DATST|nr:hypothetical protein [Datura stramonium]
MQHLDRTYGRGREEAMGGGENLGGLKLWRSEKRERRREGDVGPEGERSPAAAEVRSGGAADREENGEEGWRGAALVFSGHGGQK